MIQQPQVGVRKEVNYYLSKPILDYTFNGVCLKSVGDKRKSCGVQGSKVMSCFASLGSVQLDFDQARSSLDRRKKRDESGGGGGPNAGLIEGLKRGNNVNIGSEKNLAKLIETGEAEDIDLFGKVVEMKDVIVRSKGSRVGRVKKGVGT
ncbi:hypothetical protein Q3G72_015881 [Acer saccharum]|nr:hypothetical protein Q3G72_015881 [Acer saccharum]